MNDKLISIIIPIYNSEKYLKDLYKSIRKQTYSNYEVILINDGSTDKSEQLCINYQKKDNRVKYYKKDNTGVSDTRNFGIQQSSGEYICFVDSDDILSEMYLSDLMKIAKLNSNDLLCCDYTQFNDEKPKAIATNKKHKFQQKNKYDVLFSKYQGYLWNKLFLREIIINNNIQFNTEISMCEDMLFIFEYLKYVNNVTCIENKNYYYRIINTSASKNITNVKWFSIFLVYDEILKHKKLYSNASYNHIVYSYLFYLCEAKYRLKFIKNNKFYNEINENINLRIKNSNNIKKQLTIKQKLKITIYFYFNGLVFYIKKKKICIHNNRKDNHNK